MIDRVKIDVKAGDGGGGIISFRREKYVPFGGPDGGDGGHGGSVFILADRSMTTLLRYYQGKRRFTADGGMNGARKKMHGKNASDLTIMVPPGTLIFKVLDDETELLADLTAEGQKVMVAQGGRGGHGNTRFATPVNQAPRMAEKGGAGEEATLLLELKLIADVGIIGCP
ncbi:MAG: GTPase ObgE, partial [Dehalococcoidia bacterium]|nr:GTPase ObgE [Dehalococcoidia bacterium]